MADNGQGRAAIAIGNPDKPATPPSSSPPAPAAACATAGWPTATTTPSTSTTSQRWPILTIRQPSSCGWATTHRTVSPIFGSPIRIWRAKGGALLAADVNGLSATHEGSSHITVIGHSYGSTTVADAFAGSGMRANDAVLIGCPGTDLATSAADFHLDGGQVYVGSASTDPVSWLGTPGAIPANVLNQQLGVSGGAYAGLGATRPGSVRLGAFRRRGGRARWPEHPRPLALLRHGGE